MGAILVATPGWDAFRSAAGVRPPVPVFFEAYNKAQLQAILLRERPDDADDKQGLNTIQFPSSTYRRSSPFVPEPTEVISLNLSHLSYPTSQLKDGFRVKLQLS